MNNYQIPENWDEAAIVEAMTVVSFPVGVFHYTLVHCAMSSSPLHDAPRETGGGT